MTGDRCQRWSLRCTFVCTVQRCVGIALCRRMRETSIGLLRALRESRSKVYERVPGDDAERVEDVSEWLAGRDHLEQTPLAGEKRLREFQVVDGDRLHCASLTMRLVVQSANHTLVSERQIGRSILAMLHRPAERDQNTGPNYSPFAIGAHCVLGSLPNRRPPEFAVIRSGVSR